MTPTEQGHWGIQCSKPGSTRIWGRETLAQSSLENHKSVTEAETRTSSHLRSSDSVPWFVEDSVS